MVLPLLYGLGARDFVDLQGYVLGTCQKCGAATAFAVYQAKRKVTFYTLPTISVREQLVVECRSCGQRFAVPADMREQLLQQLLTEAQVTAHLRRAGSLAGPANGRANEPTYYQILQVDPAADPEVIDAAFRRLALKYHPDRSTDPAAPAKMRQLLEAKEVLADAAKRRAYDASIGIVRRPPAMRADEV